MDEEFSEYLDHLVEIENKRKADEEEEKKKNPHFAKLCADADGSSDSEEQTR